MDEKPRVRIRERNRVKGPTKPTSVTMAGRKMLDRLGIDKPLVAKKKVDVTPLMRRPGVAVDQKTNTLTDNKGMLEMADIPAKPREGQTRAEWEEQKVVQCEQLMLQGLREPSQLQHYLKLNTPEITASIIRRVKARWESVGTINNTKEFRGEMIGHLERLTQQLWVMYAKDTNTLNEKCYVATLLLRLLDQRMTLYGLNQETIQQVLIMTEDSEVMSKIKKQRTMAEMAARLTEKIIERRGKLNVIDVQDEDEEEEE